MRKAWCCMALLLSGSAAVAQAEAAAKPACCASAGGSQAPVACSLPSAELHHRKETVLASLKRQVIERRELDNGYAFTFPGTDAMVDELTEFIKAERACCAFLTFGLTVQGDGSTACLELIGPEGTKEVLESELGL